MSSICCLITCYMCIFNFPPVCLLVLASFNKWTKLSETNKKFVMFLQLNGIFSEGKHYSIQFTTYWRKINNLPVTGSCNISICIKIICQKCSLSAVYKLINFFMVAYSFTLPAFADS